MLRKRLLDRWLAIFGERVRLRRKEIQTVVQRLLHTARFWNTDRHTHDITAELAKRLMSANRIFCFRSKCKQAEVVKLRQLFRQVIAADAAAVIEREQASRLHPKNFQFKAALPADAFIAGPVVASLRF